MQNLCRRHRLDGRPSIGIIPRAKRADIVAHSIRRIREARRTILKTLRLLTLVIMIAMIAIPTFAAVTCTKDGVCTISPDNTLTSYEKSSGWQLLFDGKTFNGWANTNPTPGDWLIENGALHFTAKGGGYLYTKKTFGDYQFKADFMVDKGANSGIFFRWADINDPVQTGFEMQVYDTAHKTTLDKHDSGALYDALLSIAYAGAKDPKGIMLPGLGKLIKVKRPARKGRNPATGETIKIPAKKVLKFRIAKAAKDAITPPK